MSNCTGSQTNAFTNAFKCKLCDFALCNRWIIQRRRFERKAQKRWTRKPKEKQSSYPLFPARARAGFLNPFLTEGVLEIYGRGRAGSRDLGMVPAVANALSRLRAAPPLETLSRLAGEVRT